jgi:hypothetical protein
MNRNPPTQPATGDAIIGTTNQHGLEWLAAARIELLERLKHQHVSFPFDVLEFVIVRLDVLQVHAFAEFADDEHGDFRRPVEHFDMAGEVHAAEFEAGKQIAFAELLGDFRDFVKGVGNGLDVLPFERGDEGFAEMFGELLGEAFLFAAGGGKGLELGLFLAVAQQRHQTLDGTAGFLRTAFHQIEKLVAP